MRKVLFKKRIPGKSKPENEYTQEGLFHGWGTSFVEFETGPGNFTIAIIELPDGTVTEIEPSGIKFLDKASPALDCDENGLTESEYYHGITHPNG